MSGNPKIDPLFLPTAKPHPLIPLTLAHLLCIGWVQIGGALVLYVCSNFFLAFTPFLLPSCLSDSTVHSSWCLSLVAWRMCGLLNLCSLPFIPSSDWALLGWRPSPSYRAHILFFPVSVGLFAMDPARPLHHACYNIISLLYFLFPVGLQADALAVPAHFPHLYFFWALLANIFVVLAHFILRVFSAHILLLFLPLLLLWAFC